MRLPLRKVPGDRVGDPCRRPVRVGLPRLVRLLGGALARASLLVCLIAPAVASEAAFDPAQPGRGPAESPSVDIHRWTDPAGQPVFADRIAPGVSGEIVTTRVPVADAAMRARADQERAYWQAQSAAFARRQLARDRETARDYQISAGRAPDRRPSWAELPVRRPAWIGSAAPMGSRRHSPGEPQVSPGGAPAPGPGVGAPPAAFLGSGFATGR